MPDFKLVSDFKSTGDQPQAIEKLVAGLDAGQREQKLVPKEAYLIMKEKGCNA